MRSNTSHLLRGFAVFMAFLAAMFLMVAAGGATLAKGAANSAPQQNAYFVPAHDGTPEGTETEHPRETETHHPEGTETEHPRETETHEPEETETEHPHSTGTRTPEVEPSETHHLEGTETEHPRETETHHPEGTETEHPRETETRTPEATETEHGGRTGTTTPTAVNVPGSEQRTFPETGRTVKGLFLQYWNVKGGLMQQGYPISAPMQEQSRLNGKTYTVQYFERSVMEYHPENQAPFNVLLSQLGTAQYKTLYPNGAPNQVANRSNGQYFPETNHWVGGLFWDYWQQNGGLMQQGYPISDQFTEKSSLDGKTYTVQYFERSVMEYHPENQAPFNVLLSQLGTTQHNKLYGGQASHR